jgi:hypothetical protein
VPLVQGSPPSRAIRLRVAAAFAGAFFVGAVTIFAVVGLLAAWTGIMRLPFEWRLAFAGAGLLPLALVDIHASRKGRCCPIGRRRQTPRTLMRHYPMDVVATVWGLDTGLVITTFRVAAVTWAALLLVALGLSSRWAGIGYAAGFTLPFLILLWRPRLERAAHAMHDVASTDPGLDAMLRHRSMVQACSAALLLATGGFLIAGALR